MTRIRRGYVWVLAPVVALSACTSTVPMQAAPDANNPKCANVIVRLPSSLLNEPMRNTNAQATGAWGAEPSIRLTCGVTPSGPTATLCYPVKGIDWLEDATRKPKYTFTTYGRTPAVQVTIDSTPVRGQTTAILDHLANAVGTIAQRSRCLNVNDLSGTPSG